MEVLVVSPPWVGRYVVPWHVKHNVNCDNSFQDLRDVPVHQIQKD